MVQWGPALANLDADGDGLSNGFELNDPAGGWIAGDPPPGTLAGVTNPGNPESGPIEGLPGLSYPAMAWLGLLVAGIGLWRIRDRADGA